MEKPFKQNKKKHREKLIFIYFWEIHTCIQLKKINLSHFFLQFSSSLHNTFPPDFISFWGITYSVQSLLCICHRCRAIHWSIEISQLSHSQGSSSPAANHCYLSSVRGVSWSASIPSLPSSFFLPPFPPCSVSFGNKRVDADVTFSTLTSYASSESSSDKGWGKSMSIHLYFTGLS